MYVYVGTVYVYAMCVLNLYACMFVRSVCTYSFVVFIYVCTVCMLCM